MSASLVGSEMCIRDSLAPPAARSGTESRLALHGAQPPQLGSWPCGAAWPDRARSQVVPGVATRPPLRTGADIGGAGRALRHGRALGDQ
eukprot:6947595-Alexandrium_andersonii.AAC.1